MGSSESNPEMSLPLLQELVTRAKANAISMADQLAFVELIESVPIKTNFNNVWDRSKVSAGGKLHWNEWTQSLDWYVQIDRPYGRVQLHPDAWRILHALTDNNRHLRCGNYICTCTFGRRWCC